MKKLVTLAVLSLSALLIVLPVICSVNHSTSNPAPRNGVLRADGQPLPPPIPPSLAETLVADGQPLPPPIPPTLAETLVADGQPLPPPIPPTLAGNLTIA